MTDDELQIRREIRELTLLALREARFPWCSVTGTAVALIVAWLLSLISG